VSYGMYLYHLPVFWLIGGYLVRIEEPWTMGVAKVALTFLVASVSYRYLERPILGLKERFPYGPRAEAGAIPAPAFRRRGTIHARSSAD
jgi:peptidoglycan/LPS O-acetylase OafA/YrhL